MFGSTPVPEVFVLWHPRCELGKALAHRIHAWLRPGNGLGPEVFFRCLPAPGEPPGVLPPELPGETRALLAGSPTRQFGVQSKFSNLQIVLPLIDENMIADPTWRHWLGNLGVPGSIQRRLIPVALDATAYNVPPTLRKLNFLRPAGLSPGTPVATEGAVFEAVLRSLLKQLTEAMCRVLLPRPEGTTAPTVDPFDDAPPKVTVFLSHAKKDGTVAARKLRDYIYSQTQLVAFYDENDLALGFDFARAIQSSLTQTAAFLAVRSAEYAKRAWCRRELSVFRAPQLLPALGDGVDRWALYPSLVVEAMSDGTYSPGVAEFGNSPVIRWSEHTPDLAETIVTTVIRDAMLASYHSAVARSIKAPAGSSKTVIINWLPDATSLLRIDAIRMGNEVDLIYPGRGLSSMDLMTLEEYFPAVTFRCFEEQPA